jgi:hypothetical protein
MKVLKIVGLGVVIWSLSLLWPEVNERLTGLLIVILLALNVLLAIVRHFDDQLDDHAGKPNGLNKNHASRPTIPVALSH